MALTKVIGSGLGTITDASVGDDLSLVSDGSIVNFGVNSEISLTHVHNSGLTLASSVGATTFKIGRAGATDAKIIFDGNAQDYHIGVDDTNDSLVIGLGGTLGTTDSMRFDATGAITKPLQPAFLAHPSSQITNIAAGANNNLAFATEGFDQNGDYNNSNYIFTAPATGKYQLNVNLYITSLDSAVAYYELRIDTSNRTYYSIFDPDFGQDNIYFFMAFSQLVDMDASDTCDINLHQQGGSSQTDISGLSMWSMYLAC